MLFMWCRGYFFLAFTCLNVPQVGARRATGSDTGFGKAANPKGGANADSESQDLDPMSSTLKSEFFDTMSRMSETVSDSSSHTPEQIAAICGEGFNTEVLWSMDKEGRQCTCLCEFDECSVKSCPEGYDWEGNDCVKYEAIPGDIIPAKEEELQCPGGSFRQSNEKHVCAIPLSCPEPPKTSGQGVFQSMTTDCGTCQYEVSCTEPASVQMKGSVAVCYTAEEKLPDTVERRTAAVLRNCPVGTVSDEAGSCVRAVQCPTEVVLSNKALACGPQHSDYLEKLSDLMNSEAEVFKKYADHKMRVSCASSCYAMFAKFAECVEQNDAGACAGRAGMSGKGVRGVGPLGHKDASRKTASWLMMTKAQQKSHGQDDANPRGDLPCKDMYGSDIKVGQTWTMVAKHFQELANKRGILLYGSYMSAPDKKLDCRRSFCEQVNRRSGKQGEGRSLSTCLKTCETY